MASTVREKIKLKSTGKKKDGKSTGYYMTTTKNKRNTPDKIKIRKFDPRAWDEQKQKHGMYCEFVEDKIK